MRRDMSGGKADRFLVVGLWLSMAGALLSGPLALAVVGAAHPQPPWQDAATFAANYHPVQLLPYLLGLLLVSGFLVVIASLHALAAPEHRVHTGVAQLFAAAFGALIFLNYVLQTTLVPVLARPFHGDDAALLAASTMTNPGSLAWGLEMWGYGLLGVATWLSAPVLGDRDSRSRIAAGCFRLNGAVSVVGALATVWDRGWLLSPAGLIAFGAWNLLVIVMCGLALAARVHRPGSRLV
jgi:hypothetical protein